MLKCKIQIVVIMIFISTCSSTEETDSPYKIEKTDDGMQKHSVKAPKLTEEEQDSHFLPQHMTCDGCKAVGYQMFHGLVKAASRRPNKPLPESEILDVFEEICSSRPYENYALKDVDGTNMLSGEGIEKQATRPTMVQGGGYWPGRLRKICENFIDTLGEDELYANFQETRDNMEDFWQYLCYGPASGGKFCYNAKEEL